MNNYIITRNPTNEAGFLTRWTVKNETGIVQICTTRERAEEYVTSIGGTFTITEDTNACTHAAR